MAQDIVEGVEAGKTRIVSPGPREDRTHHARPAHVGLRLGC